MGGGWMRKVEGSPGGMGLRVGRRKPTQAWHAGTPPRRAFTRPLPCPALHAAHHRRRRSRSAGSWSRCCCSTWCRSSSRRTGTCGALSLGRGGALTRGRGLGWLHAGRAGSQQAQGEGQTQVPATRHQPLKTLARPSSPHPPTQSHAAPRPAGWRATMLMSSLVTGRARAPPSPRCCSAWWPPSGVRPGLRSSARLAARAGSAGQLGGGLARVQQQGLQ